MKNAYILNFYIDVFTLLIHCNKIDVKGVMINVKNY